MRAAVALQCVRNFTEKALLFLCGLCITLDTTGRLQVPVLRRQSLLGVSAKNSRKEPLHALALVAGIMRLCPGHKSDRVSIWTGRSCKTICSFVESHVNHALGLIEGPYVGILRQSNRLFHELRPDRRGRLCPAQPQIAVIVISHPDNAQ